MSKTYRITNVEDFNILALGIARDLLTAKPVKTATWQAQDVTSRPEMVSYEVMHARVELPIPIFQPQLAICTDANMPWAEDHFQERVSGEPLNPPPSEQWWPYAQQGNAEHKADQQFSHTYPERFWPIFANAGGTCADSKRVVAVPIVGVRYEYGDLEDVVELLKRDLYTRQAYLPVWFPEDTGAKANQRVPCTLGYHFLFRNELLHMEYHIRSCDYMRHWRDDVYLAGRLLQWMSERLNVAPGWLTMNIGSFHIFEGDRGPLNIKVDQMAKTEQQKYNNRLATML